MRSNGAPAFYFQRAASRPSLILSPGLSNRDNILITAILESALPIYSSLSLSHIAHPPDGRKVGPDERLSIAPPYSAA